MEKKDRRLVGLALLLLLGAGALFWLQNRPTKLNLTPYEALGIAVAEETAKLLNQSGRVVVVPELIEVAKSAYADAVLKGFRAELPKHPGVTLKEVRELKHPPTDDPRQWPAEQAELIAKAGAGADATIWLGTLPQSLTAAEVAALKQNSAKLVVVSAQSPLLKSLLQQRLVQLAIVNRAPPQAAPAGKETPRQWFERVYQIVTPETAGELP